MNRSPRKSRQPGRGTFEGKHVVVTPKPFTLALSTAAAASFGAGSLLGEDGHLFGCKGDFLKGLGTGLAGGLAIKAGLGRLPMGAIAAKTGIGPRLDALESAALAHGAKGRLALGAAKFGGMAALGTIPSLALLQATSGDKEVLGQGHDFWSGAVWGLAATAVAKTMASPAEAAKNGPLAAGWVASDFAALGIDAQLRDSDAGH